MGSGDRVTELDLLAYADGRLDADPCHKAAVEAALRADPASWDRACELRAQTKALRAAFDWRLAEPVPQRLAAALEPRPRPRAGLRATAAVMLALAAGAGGWMLGQGTGRDTGKAPVTARLSESGYAQFVAERPGQEGPAVTVAVGAAQPMHWLSDELTIRLRAPDMAAAGYALVAKETVTVDGERVVRLDYAGEDGRSFSLFLAPRWEDGRQEISEVERGGVAIASWLDGPLASALVARMPAGEVRELAEAVRAAMHAEGAVPGMLRPAPAIPAIGGSDGIADTLAVPAPDVPQTLAPQTVGETVPN